jgi:hypothetical protein
LTYIVNKISFTNGLNDHVIIDTFGT